MGGDFHYKGALGRIMTQFGMYSTMTPRNDASPVVGQWDLANAYRYLSEAYGGYHLDVMSGISEFPMRVKCATLAWHTYRNAVEEGAKEDAT